ncbi:MAG: 4'-phosphopantetheinyl transferase superfamily protein [Gammaproteobacteria bacterium]|nr:4'-phosphopantetheinyl transferase superfamily protein [Gammaproteobacteria bacterium]
MIQLSEQPLPGKASVHIWNISLDDAQLDLPELLSDDELSRYSKIKHHRARAEFLRTRASLRLILANYLQCPGADLVFDYNENGKPELNQFSSGSLKFNLSHSGNCCVLVVTEECEIGVDVEKLQSGRDYAALAQRFFTDAEYRMIEKSIDELLFYRMWVLKEAAVKARGMKLLAGLDRFECFVDEKKKLRIRDKLEHQAPENDSIWQWQPEQGMVAAIVARADKIRFEEKMLTYKL